MCPSMRAHWHHLVNTIEPVHPSAHSSQQPKWQIDQFSRFCTAHAMKSLYFTMGAHFPQNCPFSWEDQNRHLIHDLLSQTELTVQMAPLSVLLFSHRWPQSVPILYNGRPFLPKLPLPMGDLDPHLTHDSLGPSKPTNQTASPSVQLLLHRWPQSVPILYNGMPLSPWKLPLPTRGSGPPSNTWFPGFTQVLNPNGNGNVTLVSPAKISSAVLAGLTNVTDRPTDHATRSVTTVRIYVRSIVSLRCSLKMETRHPAEGYFGSEFLAIRNHFRVMAVWSRKSWKKVSTFGFFGKTTPFRKIFEILFRKSSLCYQSTCCVQILWNLADGKSVKSISPVWYWVMSRLWSPVLLSRMVSIRFYLCTFLFFYCNSNLRHEPTSISKTVMDICRTGAIL